ncbi:MAG: hypothetical protein HQK50_10035 [Oligoflexia bacterium]|nr:hypothetical protein [Oligoflexia bacterium]
MSSRKLVTLTMFALTICIQMNVNAAIDNHTAKIKTIGTTGYALTGENSVLGLVTFEKISYKTGYNHEGGGHCPGTDAVTGSGTFYFPAENEKGKVLMSLLMAAKLSNKTLTQVTFHLSEAAISGIGRSCILDAFTFN